MIFRQAREQFVDVGYKVISALKNDQPVDENTKLAMFQLWDQALTEATTCAIGDRDLEDHEKTMSITDMGILHLDNRLMSLEGNLIQNDESSDHASVSVEDVEDDGDGEDETHLSAHSGSSAPTHQLVHDYYDAIGDVNLARDHFHNLEAEHRSLLHARRSQRDMSMEPTMTDEMFYEDYFNRRSKLIEEYAKARHRVQLLQGLCKENNLEIEEPNLPYIDPATLHEFDPSALPLDLSRPVSHPFIHNTDVITWGGGRPRFQESLALSRRRVTAWIADVVSKSYLPNLLGEHVNPEGFGGTLTQSFLDDVVDYPVQIMDANTPYGFLDQVPSRPASELGEFKGVKFSPERIRPAMEIAKPRSDPGSRLIELEERSTLRIIAKDYTTTIPECGLIFTGF
jgi:hypothetical protein